MTKAAAGNTSTWTFTRRLRANAFGWRSSALAIQRVKQAAAEIHKVARTDPARAAEGAVLFAERLWPALEGVDSSSGSLGTAAFHAAESLVAVIRDAPLAAKRVAGQALSSASG